MKITILTRFRNYNYGTYLQAFSLQQFLKNYGHEPTLIKYRSLPGDTLREPIKVFDVFVNKVRNNIKRRLDEGYYKKLITTEKSAQNQEKAKKMNSFLQSVNFTKVMECADDLKIQKNSLNVLSVVQIKFGIQSF